MPYCSICGCQIDNNSLFCPKCGNRVGVVVRMQRQSAFTEDYLKDAPHFKPNSGMGLAFFTTLCCSTLIGIYAMVLADKVDTLYYSGRYREAEMKAADSKKWSIIGIIVGIAFDIIIIIVFIILIIETDGEILENL